MSFGGPIGNIIKYTTVFNKLFEKGEKHWKSFGESLNKIMTARGGYFQGAKGQGYSLTAGFGAGSISAAQYKASGKTIMESIGAPLAKFSGLGLATKPLRRVGASVSAFGGGFGADPADAAKMGRAGRAGQWVGNAMEKMTKVPAKTWKEFGSAVGGLAKAGLQSFGMGMAIDLLMKFMDALNPFKPVIETLTDIFSVYGAILSTAFMPLIEKLYDVMLNPTAMALFEILAGLLARVVTAFLPILDILSPLGLLILNALVIPLQLLTPIIELLAIPLGQVGIGIAWVTTKIGELSTWWNTYLAPIFTALGGIFATIAAFKLPDLTSGWNAIVQGFKDTLINPIIDYFNRIIGTINSWIPGTANDIGTIPRYATGALVTKPTIAMIGEAGTERVLNPSETRAYESGSRSGGGSVVLNLYGNITQERVFQIRDQLWLNNIRR